MSLDFEKGRRLFIMKKNQLKMVKRRGYNIEREEPLLSYTPQDFLDVYIPFAQKSKKSLRAVLSNTYSNDKGEKLLVYFVDLSNNKQMGVETLGDVIQEMEKYKSKNAIIITPIPLSASSKKKIQELLTYNIYTFMENEMAYDPTEHYLVPEHRALSAEEQREFLARNNLSIDQLPAILTTDMISRYYGFRTGQVIEIKRLNLYETIVQESLVYRAVREDLANI